MTGKMVDRIRRDGSFKAAGASEYMLQLSRHLQRDQAIRSFVLDTIWDDGEGELTAEQERALSTELHAGQYQWVRIYKDETYKKPSLPSTSGLSTAYWKKCGWHEDENKWLPIL